MRLSLVHPTRTCISASGALAEESKREVRIWEQDGSEFALLIRSLGATSRQRISRDRIDARPIPIECVAKNRALKMPSLARRLFGKRKVVTPA